MPIISAENSFKKGLEAFIDEDYAEAATHFRRAMDIEHQRQVLRPDMRYLSYYGLSRARAYGEVRQGLHACRRAAMLRSRDPQMFLNLGRVELLAGDPSAALAAFGSGLAINPTHPVLVHESNRIKDRLPGAKKRSGRLISRLFSTRARPASMSR